MPDCRRERRAHVDLERARRRAETALPPATVLGNILQFLIFRHFWDICANTAGATFHTTVEK
eukprot:SAG11_NODE_32168_length_285_cov_3.989247_1_plen_61_part_01